MRSTGSRMLDAVEAEGRDLVAFADQVVSRLRERLVAALESGASASASAAALSHAAKRLAGLDVNRTGAGGYRLQLELCLLESADSPAAKACRPACARQPAQPKPDKAAASSQHCATDSAARASPAAGAGRGQGAPKIEEAPSAPRVDQARATRLRRQPAATCSIGCWPAGRTWSPTSRAIRPIVR